MLGFVTPPDVSKSFKVPPDARAEGGGTEDSGPCRNSSRCRKTVTAVFDAIHTVRQDD